MRKGNYSRKADLGELPGQGTALIRTPHKVSNENNVLQWPKTRSSLGDNALWRKIIEVEVIGRHDWIPVVSPDGVQSEQTTLRRSALVRGRP
jgi:hypothetical protein